MPHLPIRDLTREKNIVHCETRTYKLTEEELARYREDKPPLAPLSEESSKETDIDTYVIHAKTCKKYNKVNL